ncbi:hypothetical protein PspLS_02914 [Pyricularia sp. CBS 133598]|nr:hypothetical protein PspLS_02914 [Pyricularia sp. CBS 133598]
MSPVGAAPPPLPMHVYKILPTAPPAPLPSPYPLSDLDKKDGFVHLSTASQIPITAGIWFKDFTELWILKLNLVKFANEINWDTPGCPHLYGNFGAEEVVDSRKFVRGDGQEWKEALGSCSDWLV